VANYTVMQNIVGAFLFNHNISKMNFVKIASLWFKFQFQTQDFVKFDRIVFETKK